jgi:hypothetical protein
LVSIHAGVVPTLDPDIGSRRGFVLGFEVEDEADSWYSDSDEEAAFEEYQR